MKRGGDEGRARRLLRWYPKAWRRRYGDEFTQLLIDDMAERPRSWPRALDAARCGLATRIALQRRSRPRLALSSVVIGVAAAAAVWVATYKSPNAERIAFTRWVPGTVRLHWSFFFTSPAWVVPSALGIGLLGLAAAAIVLRLRLTAAVFTLAAGIAAAIALHAYLIPPSCRPVCGPGGHIPTVVIPHGLSPTLPRPGWVGPTALGIVLLALATAAGALLPARRSEASRG